MSLLNVDPDPSTKKIEARTQGCRSRYFKPQMGRDNSKAPAVRDDLSNMKILHSSSSSTIRGSTHTSPALQPNITLRLPDSLLNNEVSLKPTPKLIQAIQNPGPLSKPLQVKLVKRESGMDEDTSSYESDSSDDVHSTDFRSHPNIKPTGRTPSNDLAIYNAPNGAKCYLQKMKNDQSQLPEQKVTEMSELQGVPLWFPARIKLILKDDGCPHALPFKCVHKLTKYRAWLEAQRRRKWKRYLKAGKSRWQLSNALRKLRQQPGHMTAAFYRHRMRQHNKWKEKAIRAMRKLDVVIGGITYLDETMAGIFSSEREVYQKYLD